MFILKSSHQALLVGCGGNGLVTLLLFARPFPSFVKARILARSCIVMACQRAAHQHSELDAETGSVW